MPSPHMCLHPSFPRLLRQAGSLALVAALLTGCSGAPWGPSPAASRADRVPPAKVTGKPEACIPLARFSQSRVRDGRTIDFLSSGGQRGWRNTLPDNCPGLAFEDAFSFDTSLSQLCSTDIIRVLQRTGGNLNTGAACGLGPFIPIELSAL